MSNTTNNIIIFSLGAAIGSLITWKLIKTKYEQMAEEEIDSVKEVFYARKKELEDRYEEEDDSCDEDADEDEAEAERKRNEQEYQRIINTNGYATYSYDEVLKKKATEDGDDEMEPSFSSTKPYTIPPDEFGEADGYGVETLTYYADGVLTDDWGNIIENVDELVGVDSLKTFGEYEDDSVFVRNDDLKCEYEILLDNQKYSDIYEDKGYGADSE
jgi:hypothetical protein